MDDLESPSQLPTSSFQCRPADILLRHPKERKSKCSLEPLKGREGITFCNARPGIEIDATGYLVLALNAPLIGEDPQDKERPILLPDSTWKLLPAVLRCIVGVPHYRSLPEGIETAYPRKNAQGDDPSGGLASIEAYYVALELLGRPVEGILDHYHWKDDFLRTWEAFPRCNEG